MIDTPATSTEFNTWTAHAKSLPETAIRHIMADCQKAEEAMRGWNPTRENFYRDQYLTYRDELLRRAS